MTEQTPVVPNPAPAPSNSEQGSQGSAPATTEKLIAGKYKSVDDLATAYVESEKKIGSQADEIGELRKTVETASALVSAVYSDPDIKAAVEKKYGDGAGEGTPAPTTDPKVADIDNSLRNRTIADFDKKWNIPADDKERKDIYSKIGAEIMSFGLDPAKVPTSMLDNILDKAYRLAYPEKVEEAAKNAGSAAAMTNMRASIPSQGGASLTNADGSIPLSEEQKEWLGRLHVSENKAQDILKKST